MSNLTATALYGHDPAMAAPTANPVPEHLGRPEPSVARTTDAPIDVRRPALALVVLIAAVVILTQISFRGTVEVGG